MVWDIPSGSLATPYGRYHLQVDEQEIRSNLEIILFECECVDAVCDKCIMYIDDSYLLCSENIQEASNLKNHHLYPYSPLKPSIPSHAS